MLFSRPQTGKLIELLPHDKRRVLYENKPFALLQDLKKKLIKQGYKKNTLKITY